LRSPAFAEENALKAEMRHQGVAWLLQTRAGRCSECEFIAGLTTERGT
jgi:hypothetical protein